MDGFRELSNGQWQANGEQVHALMMVTAFGLRSQNSTARTIASFSGLALFLAYHAGRNYSRYDSQ